MPKEYEVPVWFRITANTADEAWVRMKDILWDAESTGPLPDYVIEEPCPIGTPMEGSAPPDVTYDNMSLPEETPNGL